MVQVLHLAVFLGLLLPFKNLNTENTLIDSFVQSYRICSIANTEYCTVIYRS